jgi:hypothetical protein
MPKILASIAVYYGFLFSSVTWGISGIKKELG